MKSHVISKKWKQIEAAVSEIQDHHPLQLSAALSYYTMLSLAPLMLVTVALTGLVFGRDAVQGRIVEEMRGLVGDSGAEVIQTVIANASAPTAGVASLSIGILTLLIGATSVFVQLQDALNQIWGIEAKPKRHALWGFVRERLLSLAMVVGVGFLLLVSLIVSAALSALGTVSAQSGLEAFPVALQIVNTLLSFGVITLLFAMIFKFLPEVELAWRYVWFGAAVTSGLFTIGKYLIGIYLGRASIGSAYGAAGSVIVLLVWVYYAALILLLGAEITRVRARRAHLHRKQHADSVVVPRPDSCKAAAEPE